jgi:hypothetical protein
MKRRAPELFVLLVFIGMMLSAGTLQLGLDLWNREAPQVLEMFKDTPTVAELARLRETARGGQAGWPGNCALGCSTFNTFSSGMRGRRC